MDTSTALTHYAETYSLAKQSVRALDPVRNAHAYVIASGMLAKYASKNHSGIFADPDIENALQRIGQNLGRYVAKSTTTVPTKTRSAGNALRVLHVATRVRLIGGHTRTIENWVKTDHDNCHSLFLTQQGSTAIRSELAAAIERSGGTVVLAHQDQDDLQTAMQLRIEAERLADIVILHHYPQDLVPTLAFATNQSPPIAVLNHAGHQFWLGSAVADAVINLREACAHFSHQRRFARQSLVLPIPLDPDETLPDRKHARAQLDLPADCRVFATIGRGTKYRPSPHGNFFHTVSELTGRYPDAKILFAGLSREYFDKRTWSRPDPHFYFLGDVPDTRAIRSGADVYLEGFPFGSHTALLEAGRSRLPIVRSYAAPTELLAAGSGWLDAVVPRPTTQNEYIERALRLMDDESLRHSESERVYQQLEQFHWGANWLQRLRPVYAAITAQPHSVTPLPATQAHYDETDIAIAQWRKQTDPNDKCEDPETTAGRLLHGITDALRKQGEYRAAARLLWSTARQTRHRRSSLAKLVKLAPSALLQKTTSRNS